MKIPRVLRRRWILPWAALMMFVLIIDPAEGVEIIDLVMPETAESGNDSEIILDCDYDFSDEERNQLEVKWYFNGDHKPFFQWIPGKDRKPQLSGERFANHIDLEFVAHEDEAKQYRALKIVNPSPELSGSYRCKVSTLIDEDFKQRDLIVYVPPESIDLELEAFEDLVNLTCLVSGVFPEPLLSISWEGKNESAYELNDDLIIMENPNNAKYFDALLRIEINHTQLDMERETVFICQITLPPTNFSMAEEMVFVAPKTEIEEIFEEDENEEDVSDAKDDDDDDDEEEEEVVDEVVEVEIIKNEVSHSKYDPNTDPYNGGLGGPLNQANRDRYLFWTCLGFLFYSMWSNLHPHRVALKASY